MLNAISVSYTLLIILVIVNAFPYYDIQQFLGEQQKSWSGQIKSCMETCRKVLHRGHKDMNYCIEGCRIRIYRPIYSCVYEQCNNRGQGINELVFPSKYHHCVHLCKLKSRAIRFKPIPTTERPSTSTYDYQYYTSRHN